MRRLNGFNKSNKKRNIVVISAFLIISLFVVGISYAVYQKTDEIQFINAKVGSFDTSNSDIELAIMVDGIDVDVPPKKENGYYNIVVECDHADGSWDKDRWGANIDNISSKRVKCNVNFETIETLPLSIVEIGDYISMTPTSTSYTISSILTGYGSNQTINPSELNLWRVIKKNEDGTVDVVSEYVSSTGVYFKGQTGYLNFVGGLNTISAQYINTKYVSKTRHMGYFNQIQKCNGTLQYGNSRDCDSDTGYETDKDLVENAIGSLKANDSRGTAMGYWLASRSVYKSSSYDAFAGRYINTSGGVETKGVYSANSVGEFMTYEGVFAVRPIATLKSTCGCMSGNGTSGSPYELG